MKSILILAAAAAATLPITPVEAQVFGTVRVRAGLGAQVRPRYLGDDGHDWALYPNVSVVVGDKPFGFGAPDDSLGVKLFSTHGFSFGPVADLRQGRDDSDVGAPVGDISRTIELGGYAQKMFGEHFRIRGELRKGINGHDGIVGIIGADAIARKGDRFVFSIGPRLRYGNSSFQDSYFGVSSKAAFASGLPVYRPGGGLYEVGVTSGLDYPIGGGWGIFGYARYDRLVGDARKSPIVQRFGSPDQFAAGIGLNHSFTLNF